MRPVDRGDTPVDGDGQAKVFADYRDARPDLIDSVGDYCSFCEVSIAVPIDVEHIRHKDGNPDLELEWSNFLLACKNCNSTKGTKVMTQQDVDARMWPHLHHSFTAFEYSKGGVVRLSKTVSGEPRQRAEATAEMVGLFKRPGNGLNGVQIRRGTDRRYQKRSDAWELAVDARADLSADGSASNPAIRRLVVALAKATGFWSVWRTVFAADPQMCRELDKAFRGTATDRAVHPVTPQPEAGEVQEAAAAGVPGSDEVLKVGEVLRVVEAPDSGNAQVAIKAPVMREEQKSVEVRELDEAMEDDRLLDDE